MFQKSVLSSVKQDEGLIVFRWVSYQKNLAKIEYIKTVKEEQIKIVEEN